MSLRHISDRIWASVLRYLLLSVTEMFKNGGHIIYHLHECAEIEKWPQLAVYQVIKLSNMFLCRDTYYIVTSVKFSYTHS